MKKVESTVWWLGGRGVHAAMFRSIDLYNARTTIKRWRIRAQDRNGRTKTSHPNLQQMSDDDIQLAFHVKGDDRKFVGLCRFTGDTWRCTNRFWLIEWLIALSDIHVFIGLWDRSVIFFWFNPSYSNVLIYYYIIHGTVDSCNFANNYWFASAQL